MPCAKNVHTQPLTGFDYREIGDKFGVGASCKKVNTSGTHENLFKLVPVPRHDPRPEYYFCVRAPTKGYVHTGTRARARYTGDNSERGHSDLPSHARRGCEENVT